MGLLQISLITSSTGLDPSMTKRDPWGEFKKLINSPPNLIG